MPSWDDMMLSIKEFYHSREVAGIPKRNTHDIAEFEVKIKHLHHFPQKWGKKKGSELCARL